MSLPPLTIKIGADTIDLSKALQDVAAQFNDLQKVSDRIGKGFADFGDAAGRLGGKMLPLSGAISGAAAGAFLLAKNTADAGNAIDKSALAVGLSTDAYQELSFAIGQVSDVTEQQFTVAMRQMQTRMGQAASGSQPMIDAFAAIGVSQEELASGTVTTEEAFNRLNARMQEASSPAEAAAVAGRLLGEEAAKLGPILMQSGGSIDDLRERAQELGIVLSGETVAASAEFTDKMDEVNRQVRAAKDQIGQALLPVAISMATTFQEKVLPAIVSVAQGIADAIDWFGQLPGPVQEAAAIVGTALGVGGPILLAVGAMSKAIGALVVATGPIGLFIGAAALLTAAWIKWGDDIKAALGTAFEWMKTSMQGVVDFYLSIPGRMLQIGRDIVAGLWNGLTEAWANFSITETLSGWGASIRDTFAGALGIQSPSTVFHGFGLNIGEGLRNGIVESFGMVRSAVQGLGGQVTSGAFDMAKGVVDAMGQMFQGSKPIAMAQALINTFQGITEALKLPFPKNLVAAAKVAAQGFAAVRGIASARPGSTGAAGGAGTSASAPPPAQFNIALDIIADGQGNVPVSAVQSLVSDLQNQLNRGARVVA